MNVRADAHYLPFRDKAFEQTRCWHVIEHLNNPRLAIGEILRVSRHYEIRFPVGDGYKREMLWTISCFSPSGIVNAFRTRAWGAHLWTIRPTRGVIGYRRLFSRLFTFGRKARYLRRFEKYLPKIRYEWIVAG